MWRYIGNTRKIGRQTNRLWSGAARFARHLTRTFTFCHIQASAENTFLAFSAMQNKNVFSIISITSGFSQISISRRCGEYFYKLELPKVEQIELRVTRIYKIVQTTLVLFEKSYLIEKTKTRFRHIRARDIEVRQKVYILRFLTNKHRP